MKRTDGLKPFQPGESGNPAGRPKGSRNKLGEAFLQELFSDFAEHGARAIVAAREADPLGYVKVVAGFLPKEVKISDDRNLSDDDLDSRIRTLAEALGLEIRRTH